MRALAVCQGTLVVGGYFNQVGDGLIAQSIVRWDGENWIPLGSGIGSGGYGEYQYVFEIIPLGNWLYAGGNFNLAGGQPVNRIARWDGAAWRPLGMGLDSYVFALTLHDNALMVGGEFGIAGGIPAEHIARWDGMEWSALGSGLDSHVHDLLPIGDDLYVGGWFDRAGNKPSYSIARWNRELAEVTYLDDRPARPHVRIPNPYRCGETISFMPAQRGLVEVSLFNVSGRLIRSLQTSHAEVRPYHILWDGTSDAGSAANAGIYYLRINHAGASTSRPVVFIR